MTVKELINFLKQDGNADGDKQILIARDEEGNGFGTVEEGSIEVYKDKVIIFPWKQIDIDWIQIEEGE